MDRSTGIKVYSVAIISTILMGFSFLGAKTALMYASPIESLFFRFAIAFIFAVVLILMKIIKIDLKRKEWKKLLIPAFLYSCCFFGFQFFGLMYASSVEGGIIMSMQPAVAMLLAEIVIKEKANFKQKLCVTAAIFSTIFISVYGSGGIGNVDIRGVILLFLSVLSMSGNVVYLRWIRKDFTPVEVSFVSCTLGFIVYFIVILIYGGINGGIGATFSHLAEPQFVIAVIYLGVGCTMLTTLMNSYLVKHLEAVRTSVFGSAGTIITLLAGFFILHESLGIVQIIFCSVILIAVIGTNYFGRRKEEQHGKIER